MRKFFSLLTALTLCVGLWADDVITYTAEESLQALFNNFQPEPMSNDYDEGTSTGTVIFPDLNEIGNEAFKDCSALTSITLPASIERIGDAAFANCENLQSITCKASQPPMCERGAFENVPSEIPLYVPALSVDAYQSNWWWFNTILPLPIVVGDQFKDEATGLYFEITSLETPKTVKVVPRMFDDYKNASYNIPSSVTSSDVEYIVTEIGNDAFYNCWKVTSITLPSTITTIGADAFCYCAFSSIDLPAALTAIGSYAFLDCKNLQSITVPANVTTIDNNAFNGCTALQEVTFLGNACQNAIGNDVFNNVGSTTPATLVLPDNWTGSKPDKDGNWYDGKFNYDAPAPVVSETFEDATSGLKFQVTTVGDTNTVWVIANGYSGTSYTVPATVTYKNVTFAVTTIGNEAFFDCSSLESIIISEGVTTIGNEAFYYCTSLQSVTLPESVTTIGDGAFGECSSLQSVTLPESLTTLGSAFAYSGLQSITIPEGVTAIKEYTFEGCESLQSVTLPESLTAIGYEAFIRCSGLQSITIPANVTEIGERAFVECSNLTDIYVAWTTKLPTMGEPVFENIPDTATLYVPFGFKVSYQKADEWKNFNNIVEYDPFVNIRTAALAEITTARQGIQNTNINNKIDAAALDIQNAIIKEEIERIRHEILEVISAFKDGIEDGKAEAQAELPTEGTSGPAVVITQGDKSITLINPDEVRYTIITEE